LEGKLCGCGIKECSMFRMPISYSLPRRSRVVKSKSGRVVRRKKRSVKKGPKGSTKKSSPKKTKVVRDSPKIFRA